MPVGNEGTLENIRGNCGYAKEAIESDIGQKVQRAIKNANRPSMRRNRTSQFKPVVRRRGVTASEITKKTRASIPVVRGSELERVGADSFSVEIPQQERQRHEAVNE